MIAPYVEKDPTKFCTYEEFEQGVSALKLFCRLREESVKGQLNGSIPSTSEGQSGNGSSLINASELKLSEMGTMNNGGMGGGFGGTSNKGSEEGNGGFGDFGGFGEKPDMGGEFPKNGMFPPDGESREPDNRNGASDSEKSENGTGENKTPPDFGNMEIPIAESGGDSIILLAVSAAVLGAGLLFAGKFK